MLHPLGANGLKAFGRVSKESAMMHFITESLHYCLGTSIYDSQSYASMSRHSLETLLFNHGKNFFSTLYGNESPFTLALKSGNIPLIDHMIESQTTISFMNILSIDNPNTSKILEIFLKAGRDPNMPLPHPECTHYHRGKELGIRYNYKVYKYFTVLDIALSNDHHPDTIALLAEYGGYIIKNKGPFYQKHFKDQIDKTICKLWEVYRVHFTFLISSGLLNRDTKEVVKNFFKQKIAPRIAEHYHLI